MEEAASHSGGAHGVGGDILYRWGNPEAYGAGNESDRILYGPHDAQWIAPGSPGEGNILVFNNGRNKLVTRPEGEYSTVDEFTPPLNEAGTYDRTPDQAFGPTELAWRYIADPATDFFAGARSGTQRLPDGNTLIANGPGGYTFEVTPEKETVWNHTSDGVFKARRYYPPSLGPIPDQQATEDMVLKLDLSSFVSDPDTDNMDLFLDENSSYASITEYDLELLYPEGIMTDVINLTLSDGVFEVGTEIRITVTSVNDPPIWATVPDVETTEDEPFTFDLEPYLSDPDTPISGLVVTENSSYATITGNELELLYPNGVLGDVINLTVTDGESETSTEIHVNVIPVHDPPVVAPIPDQELLEDVPFDLDLGAFISDVDTPPEGLSIISDSDFAIVEGMTLKMQYPDGVASDVVNLTVGDGELWVVVQLNVAISPVNDAPELLEPGVGPLKGNKKTNFNFTVVFKDIDLGDGAPVVEIVIDDISHPCSRADPEDGTFEEGVTFFNDIKLKAGNHTCYFKAEDGDGGSVTSDTFWVLVSDDTDDGADDLSDIASFGIGIIIVGVVVILAFVLWSRSRSSRPDD
jgi:hypothetical protein